MSWSLQSPAPWVSPPVQRPSGGRLAKAKCLPSVLARARSPSPSTDASSPSVGCTRGSCRAHPGKGAGSWELPGCAFHCILNISPVRGPADELVYHDPKDHRRTERRTEKRVQVAARMGGPTWASEKHYSPTSSTHTPPLCPHQPNSQCPSQPQNSTLLGRSKLQDKSGTFLRGLG